MTDYERDHTQFFADRNPTPGGPWRYCPWCYLGTHTCSGVAPLSVCACLRCKRVKP